MRFDTVRRQGAADQRELTLRRDGVALAARLLLPSVRPPFPCVVFVHGLGSSKDSPRNVVIAARLVDAGIAALLFDLSGHGDSSPDPRGEEAFVDDLVAAYGWARGEALVRPASIGVAGSSLGAVVALMAVRAGRIRPAAMVLRAPPAEPRDFGGLDVPTLVIVGSHDPLRRQLDGAERHAGVMVSVVEGAGHLFEEPGTLERALELTVGWFAEQLR